MTKWGKLVIVSLILILGTSTMVYGKKDNSLRSTKKIMKGHIVALYLDHIFNTSSTIYVSFNEKESLIELEIWGSDRTIDEAKASTEDFRQGLLAESLERLNNQFELTLSEQDVVITYIYHYSKERLLVFKDGNYTLD